MLTTIDDYSIDPATSLGVANNILVLLFLRLLAGIPYKEKLPFISYLVALRFGLYRKDWINFLLLPLCQFPRWFPGIFPGCPGRAVFLLETLHYIMNSWFKRI